uniref:Uncharacterized protein n=1 Tax=Anguilla anguilla TaxID=7936 RepID=A0A0E9W6A6_ANGAN
MAATLGQYNFQLKTTVISVVHSELTYIFPYSKSVI